MSKSFILALVATVVAFAHPMGNFSINHYARLDLAADSVNLSYVLDLAELPTLELLQQWKLSGRTASEIDPKAVLTKAEVWAPELLSNLRLDANGQPLKLHVRSVAAHLLEGAGGMPTARIIVRAEAAAAPGTLNYADRNFPNRTGWKEIVIHSGEGIALSGPAQRMADLSHELTIYPADLTIAPPQDLQASTSWTVIPAPPAKLAKRPTRSARQESTLAPVIPSPVPDAGAVKINPEKVAQRAFAPARQAAGAVVAGDFLSTMFREKHFGPGMILLGVLVAFGLGSAHALSPGHGKTIVAAYLVGSRGTPRHALLLGLTVTFTHTVSVFLLGIGVLLFQKSVLPDRAVPLLGAVSGLSIFAIGAWLLYTRCSALRKSAAKTAHHHHHDHPHPHSHSHDHAHEPHAHDHHHHAHSHEPAHSHAHAHAAPAMHTHSHGGHTHSHAVPEGPIGLGSLLALGVSGGLVPCPSALILLLSAISLGRTGLGLILLLGFSAGLALVLVAIGVAVLYARHLFPEARRANQHPVFRYVPILSALVVMVLGLLMTMTAAGIVSPIRFLA